MTGDERARVIWGPTGAAAGGGGPSDTVSRARRRQSCTLARRHATLAVAAGALAGAAQ